MARVRIELVRLDGSQRVQPGDLLARAEGRSVGDLGHQLVDELQRRNVRDGYGTPVPSGCIAQL